MERTWCLLSESTHRIIVIVIIITIITTTTTITTVVLCNIFPLPFYDSVCAVAAVSHNTSLNKNWTEINLIIIISLHHCHYRSADWTDAESRSPVVLPKFCSRSVDILWREPQSGRYSNTGTFWHVMSMVRKLINAVKNSSNICTTWFNVATHTILSAQCMCTLHVNLTTNNSYFPENFNWLFFVIAMDCVLCEKGTQFLAYFLSLCVWRK